MGKILSSTTIITFLTFSMLHVWAICKSTQTHVRDGGVHHRWKNGLKILTRFCAQASEWRYNKAVQQTEGSTRPIGLDDSTQSEERYQAFIRNSSEGIWRFELDAPIPVKLSVKEQVRRIFETAYVAEANRAAAKMYGFSSGGSFIGLHLDQFMAKSDPEVVSYLESFVNGGYKLSDTEYHQVDSAGNDMYFRNSVTGTVEDGCLVRAWSTQQDVTQWRSANQALKRSEERLTLALRASTMGLWEWDLKRDQLYWSDELIRLYGLPLDHSITYKEYLGLVHPDDKAQAQKVIQTSMKTGEPYQFEHRITWPDGSQHWLLGQGQAYLEAGEAVRMIGTCVNIDARKQAEAVTRRQNSFLQMLHASAVEASQSIGQEAQVLNSILSHAGTICDTPHGYIYLVSDAPDELRVKLASGKFKAHVGHTIKKGEGLAGRVWQTNKPIIVNDYDTWSYRQRSFPKGLMNAAVGVPLQTAGTTIGVLALVHDSPGKHFDSDQLSALQRLSDLASITLNNAKLFEELQESEQRFRSLADTAPVLIWISGVDMGLTYFNKPWCDFTGRSMDEETGDGWMHSIYPGDLDFCYQTYKTAFDNREPYSMEYRIRRYDGVFRWILDKGVPRFSSTGEFQGFIGSCIDIDDMKRANDLVMTNAQLKSQQAQLLAVNKTKDEFIALASHQLRTPATAVKQYTSLLINEFAGPVTPEQLKYLRIAFDSNERQLQIINDLLKTAQIDSSRYVLEKKPQDIAKIIKQAAKELRATCELKNQKITLIGIKSTTVEVDANEIKLALINLLENASKYSYPDTEITLRMHNSGKRLEIAVTDVGVGVSKADARRIFDKFTRVDNELSDTVTGTGFGLYWVKRIINLHGGSIKVESAVGKGATFIVRLPL